MKCDHGKCCTSTSLCNWDGKVLLLVISNTDKFCTAYIRQWWIFAYYEKWLPTHYRRTLATSRHSTDYLHPNDNTFHKDLNICLPVPPLTVVQFSPLFLSFWCWCEPRKNWANRLGHKPVITMINPFTADHGADKERKLFTTCQPRPSFGVFGSDGFIWTAQDLTKASMALQE